MTVGMFALAALATAAFVGIERRSREPLLELRFFASPPFTGAAAMATLAFFILAGFLFLNTLYLQEVRGDSALIAGVATLPAMLVIVLVSPLTGRLVARRGNRLPMTTGGLFLAGGALVLSHDTTLSSYAFLTVGYVLLGLGFALINPPITSAAMAGMPTAQAGVASGVATSSRQLGNVLGIAIIGSVVTSQLHNQLDMQTTLLDIPRATKAALHHAATANRGLRVPHTLLDAARADQVLRAAFTTASHTGWDLAIASGLIITILAYLTTSARAQARATATMNER